MRTIEQKASGAVRRGSALSPRDLSFYTTWWQGPSTSTAAKSNPSSIRRSISSDLPQVSIDDWRSTVFNFFFLGYQSYFIPFHLLYSIEETSNQMLNFSIKMSTSPEDLEKNGPKNDEQVLIYLTCLWDRRRLILLLTDAHSCHFSSSLTLFAIMGFSFVHWWIKEWEWLRHFDPTYHPVLALVPVSIVRHLLVTMILALVVHWFSMRSSEYNMEFLCTHQRD